jgi:hypothetical protein
MLIRCWPQAYTLRPPFWYIEKEVHVIVRVSQGEQVKQPTVEECRGLELSDALWSTMEACWATPASRRPSAMELVEALHEMTSSDGVSPSLLSLPSGHLSRSHGLERSRSYAHGQTKVASVLVLRRSTSDSRLRWNKRKNSQIPGSLAGPPLPTQQLANHVRLPNGPREKNYQVKDPRKHLVHGRPLPNPPDPWQRIRPDPQKPLPTLPGKFQGQGTLQFRIRRGFWNRRGDHLTADLQVVYAPEDLASPPELADYPSEEVGYRDHDGTFVPYDGERPELPESLPSRGKPPKKPYAEVSESVLRLAVSQPIFDPAPNSL